MELSRRRFSYPKRLTVTRDVVIVLCLILLCSVAIIWFFSQKTHSRSSVSSFLAANGTEYKFPCVISHPEAISSIDRANSDKCKIEIANAACKSEHGRLFPATIAHRCPRGKYVPYRSVGCFPYDPLLYTVNNRISENTPKSCADTCMTMAFRYAGVVSGTFCVCGDTEPNLSLLQTDSKCNKKCPGNPKQMCGGAIHASIYETGLAKHPTDPLKLVPKPGEKPARIAFLLMAHKRNLRQVRRLLGVIYDPNHYYYIHVDARQHYLYREMLNVELDFPNIYVARQRHTPAWGCDSLLQVKLQCIQAILARPSWEPDFVINLSESDFPVKSVTQLTSFLTANRGRNFLLHQKVLTPDKYIPSTGLNKNYVECSGRMWGIGKRSLPTGILYTGGSDWFCLSKEFAKYIVDTSDDLVGDLHALMKYSGFGTETFFHTLLFNSRFCQTHYDSNLRLVSWKIGQGCSKSETIDWNGCSPVCIRNDDWSKLMHLISESDHIFLARKFNPIFDQAIILRMEEKIYGKYPANTPNLNSYWENVYHHVHDHKNNRKAAALVNIAHALLNAYGRENSVHRYDALNVLEITHYFDRNSFYGFLIRHEALLHDQIVELELLVKPSNMFTRVYANNLELNTKSLQIYVSNYVDKTERLPTDFEQVLTVDQAPNLVVHLPTDKLVPITRNHTVRVDWINPDREVMSVQEFTINENPKASNNHVLRSQMNLPLTPGPWEAKVFFNESVVGVVEFLLTSNVEPIPQCNTCTHCPLVGLRDFIENQCKISDRDLYFHTLPHPRATLKRFFEVKKVCAFYEKTIEHSLADKLFENCYETLWSSVATDLKSDINYLIKRQQLNRGS